MYDIANAVSEGNYRGTIEEQIRQYADDADLDLDSLQRRQIATILHGRVSGFGPLSPLMADDTVRDIAVNAPDDVWVLRSDGWEREPDIHFGSGAELTEIMTRLVSDTGSGMSLTRADPIVDARLRNGGPRICAVIPPAAPAPMLTVRKYRMQRLDFADLVRERTMSTEMATILFACVRSRLNLMIAGATGSGKTTILAALLSVVPGSERLVIIEDTPEIEISLMNGGRPNAVRLLADRNDERRSADEMLRASLRMSPDRIIVGEVRGGEALTMLQAMNTGHEGSMSTIHANSTSDVLSRLETLALMSKLELPWVAVRGQIAAALDVIIYVARLQNTGRHVVSEIAEVVWGDASTPQVRQIFIRESSGAFRAVARPTFWNRLVQHFSSSLKDPFPDDDTPA